MSEPDWNEIAGKVAGTTMSPGFIAETFGVDEEDVEQKLGEEGVETCEGCGWWFVAAGVGTGDEDLLCEDCRTTDS